MFKEIIDRADIKKVASPDDKIKLKNRDLYEYILRPNDIYDEISFEHNDIISCYRNSIYDINFVNEHYKPLIGRILKYEFNDSKDSIPLPNFMGQNTNHRKTIAEDVISDNLVSSKFGIEMLKNSN
ncbi:unnamed protein product [Rhizophagus irregularis]|nr:unnamed protein product [Rhizophagus irregularis]